MTKVNLRWFYGALATVGLTLAGCGSPEGAAHHLPTYDVRPRVTVDGEPFGGAQLIMSPADKASGLPNSGAALDAEGKGRFSTYAPNDGIPAGAYQPSLMADSLHVKPIPQVKPQTVTITEDMAGQELHIDFESTGRMRSSPLPPP
jgi:hypothetical protein